MIQFLKVNGMKGSLVVWSITCPEVGSCARASAAVSTQSLHSFGHRLSESVAPWWLLRQVRRIVCVTYLRIGGLRPFQTVLEAQQEV